MCTFVETNKGDLMLKVLVLIVQPLLRFYALLGYDTLNLLFLKKNAWKRYQM